MKILSIGNSFSSNAHRYIHEIALANGITVNTFNLGLGSCSLEKHYQNMMADDEVYSLNCNGHGLGKSTIKNALSAQLYDVVTLQQVSNKGRDIFSFDPYLTELIAYVKKYQPRAKIYLHESWAYKPDSDTLTVREGFATHSEMFAEVEKGYKYIYSKHPELNGLIESGNAVNRAVAKGLSDMYSDNLHLGSAGKYTVGLLWLRQLVGKNIKATKELYLDVLISDEELNIIDNIVNEVLK